MEEHIGGSHVAVSWDLYLLRSQTLAHLDRKALCTVCFWMVTPVWITEPLSLIYCWGINSVITNWGLFIVLSSPWSVLENACACSSHVFWVTKAGLVTANEEEHSVPSALKQIWKKKKLLIHILWESFRLLFLTHLLSEIKLQGLFYSSCCFCYISNLCLM